MFLWFPARLLSAVFQLLLPNELLTNFTQPVNTNSVIVLLSEFYSTVPNTEPTFESDVLEPSSVPRVWALILQSPGLAH